MDRDDAKLAALREKMSDDQRKAMADIIGAELRRRESDRAAKPVAKLTTSSTVNSSSISGGLDSDQLGDLYAEVGKTMQHAKAQKQMKHSSANRRASRETKRQSMNISITPGRVALLAGIAALTVLKIVFSGTSVNASIDKGSIADVQNPEVIAAREIAVPAKTIASTPIVPAKSGNWSAAERELLAQLDQRRVELEKRRELLDARESELKTQSNALNERIAELRGLTGRLADTRKALDARYEERMEQLANVYGSMQPKEAAPLIAKLDDQIALSLLERMPAKRLGQILSLVPPDRAIELTRNLTDRQKVQ